MKRIATTLLLVVLSVASMPATAQIFRGPDSARQAEKASKKTQKAQNKAARRQQKALQKQQKAQRKAARKG